MKKLKFENKLGWTHRFFHCSRKKSFENSLERGREYAINYGWLYVFFWDTKLKEEFSE